ncbi:unnamed protein product [Scytosiphon promiscuus]
MVRKKVDARVRSLIENGVKTNHRSTFVLVGDHGKDQVVNLHYILSKARVASRPSVLWCYKKELGFSTHRKKRMRELKRQKKSGLASAGGSSEDPFELFVNSTNIRWCYYKETERVLGQTFGVLVLQDFEALTPNLLARTIETVEGGGLVILLLKTVTSLKQLYAMSMDVHSRFRTESSGDVVGRFNERFMLTLGDCRSCLICDDELNVLPLSSHARDIVPLPPVDEDAETTEAKELRELKESLEGTPPVGPLVAGAKTLDQARALLTFMEAISEKTLKSTVALTASRCGVNGKSAAIGLCLAGAIAYGYSNIFVTAPSPENLSTVFEFVLKGFDLLHFSEHLDYEVIQSTNPDFHRAVVRINVFKDHRQTIQYIQPHDSEKLSHCELLAVDEAAAIPLPLVKNLLGPYLVFLSSTVNGYEGTGRALSLKLIDQLRKQQGTAAAQAARIAASEIHGTGKKKGKEKVHENRWKVAADAAANASKHGGGGGGRTLREVTLETPIRYGANDPIEAWLYRLLCLDAKVGHHRLVCGTPAPKDCELYYVNKDALFSYHSLSEGFLQRVMSLYTSAHYKNQPNDLQMLSDAPAHHLFVLLGPKAMEQGEKGSLPDVLVVIQVVALEGQISRASLEASLSRGHRASGDLIPWSLSQQYQDGQFAGLSGARVVRIATHTDVQKMGYGSRAIDLLTKYYEGKMFSGAGGTGGEDGEESSESEEESSSGEEESSDEGEGGKGKHEKSGTNGKKNASALSSERLAPREKLPPLLVSAGDRPPERLHWLGASFGVTGQLLRLWKRAGFKLVYLRQTTSDLTGEHTGVMLRALDTEGMEEKPEDGWLASFAADCRCRVVSLLGHEFQGFDCTTALSLVEAAPGGVAGAQAGGGTVYAAGGARGAVGARELSYYCGPHDLKRLGLYSRNLVDYHLITDLLPMLAKLYFLGRMPSTRMSHLQEAILLAMGLQHRSVTLLSKELQLPDNQVLALFNKAVRKLCNCLTEVAEKAAEEEMETASSKQKRLDTIKSAGEMSMLPASMDEDLDGGAKEAMKKMAGKQEQLLDAVDLAQYAVRGTEADWDAATKKSKVAKGGGGSTTVSIKSKARPAADGADAADNGGSSKKSKNGKKRRSEEEDGGGGASSPVPNGGKTKKKKKQKGGKKA